MTKWIMNLIYSTGYFGIVFLMFAENVLGTNFRKIGEYLDIAAYIVFGVVIAAYLRRVFNYEKQV